MKINKIENGTNFMLIFSYINNFKKIIEEIVIFKK